jgi:hypothetical protein
MDPVAIGADRYVGILLAVKLFSVYGCPVKLQLIRRQPGIVHLHILDIRMASAAEIRYAQPPRRRFISSGRVHGQVGIAFIEAASGVATMAILAAKSHIAMDIAGKKVGGDSGIGHPIARYMTVYTA